jgi:hypothetical protein
VTSKSARQGEIIRELAKPQQTELPNVTKLAKALVRELANQNEFGKTRS